MAPGRPSSKKPPRFLPTDSSMARSTRTSLQFGFLRGWGGGVGGGDGFGGFGGWGGGVGILFFGEPSRGKLSLRAELDSSRFVPGSNSCSNTLTFAQAPLARQFFPPTLPRRFCFPASEAPPLPHPRADFQSDESQGLSSQALIF